MSCPSPIALSMHADGESSAHESRMIEQHAATCAACRARIEALSDEGFVLRAALKNAEDAAVQAEHFDTILRVVATANIKTWFARAVVWRENAGH